MGGGLFRADRSWGAWVWPVSDIGGEPGPGRRRYALGGIADADLAFNCGMLAHHQAAIDMARIELKYGTDADSRKMAEAIIEAQTREISEMSARIAKLARR